jgi:hypothetical protein
MRSEQPTNGGVADSTMSKDYADARMLEDSLTCADLEDGTPGSSDTSNDMMSRIFILEHLVRDLLIKNERLRQRLQDLL